MNVLFSFIGRVQLCSHVQAARTQLIVPPLACSNKVVSTALIRVFGRQLAELPLLATSPSHQGQVGPRSLLLSANHNQMVGNDQVQ